MSRSKRQTRAWHNPLRVWLFAVLASVSTLVACSEMPTSSVDEIDPADAPLPLTEALEGQANAVAASANGVSVTFTGRTTVVNNQSYAFFDATWPNLERSTAWVAHAWPLLPRGFGFRSPFLRCVWGSRRGRGCTTRGEGSTFQIPQGPVSYTVRFHVWQLVPYPWPRRWERIYLGFVTFTVPAVGQPNQAPTAAFTPSCTDLNCAFDGAASSDPDGSIAGYAWDFGDGSQATGPSPAHTYANAGTYNATLTVTDDQGATGTDSQQVTVTAPNQAPTATFTNTCTDLDCTFDGSAASDPDGSIVGYAWDFGDGNTGTGAAPPHSYSGAGTYDVTLTVTDDQGATGADTRQITVVAPNQAPTAQFSASCTNLDCVLDGSTSSDPDGSIAAYAWDFGDGNNATGQNPAHSFAAAGTYDITLTVTDDQGATGTDTQQVMVMAANVTPTASFAPTCTDLDCGFDASASSDPDGSIASYAWDFGDGNAGTGASPAHTYAAAGTYDVTLTVTDDMGATGTDTQQVSVTAANQPPTASFAPNCTDLDCGFDGSASSDPDGSITSYAWDFGDGGTDTGATPAHTYAAAGTYDVTLTVTDDMGATGTDTQQVTVAVANQSPTATFVPSCTDLDCGFDGSASSDPDGSIASYAWDFGDGNTGTGATPAHTYASGGTFDVTLTVTDDLGGTGTDTQQVTVVAPNQPPTASFAPSCTGLNCSFDGGASADPDGSIASYAWDFGDGSTGTGQTPAHSYAAGGSYSVTLTVTDDGGATATDSQLVTVTAPATGVNQLGLTIPGLSAAEQMGRAVAMSDNGSRILVGAPNSAAAGQLSGQVRAFEWNGSAWNQLGQNIDGFETILSLGNDKTIAMSGNGTRIALGTPSSGPGSRGSVIVYELSGNTWVKVGQEIIPAASSQFGAAVSLSTNGNRIAIGGPAGGGRAEVYELVGNTWTQMGSSLLGTSPDRLGYDVSLSGDGTRLLASAQGAAVGSTSGAGKLKVYDWNGSSWNQVGGDIDGRNGFGLNASMSRDGRRVVGYAAGSGDYAAVFELIGSNWVQMGFDFSVPGAFDVYQNVDLSASGNRLVLGSMFGPPNGNGTVGIYDWNGSSWIQVGSDVVGDHTGAHLGWSVAISADGSRMVAGMQGFNGPAGNGSGGAKVFTIN